MRSGVREHPVNFREPHLQLRPDSQHRLGHIELRTIRLPARCWPRIVVLLLNPTTAESVDCRSRIPAFPTAIQALCYWLLPTVSCLLPTFYCFAISRYRQNAFASSICRGVLHCTSNSAGLATNTVRHRAREVAMMFHAESVKVSSRGRRPRIKSPKSFPP